VSEKLCSVGVDVGTTTTQLVVSELEAENRASSFAVPRMEITGRKLLYESAIHFTPLLSGELVNGDKLRQIVAEEYKKAGICPGDVQTGAIIITGETSRKENAAAVLEALASFAGEFVVATAGPDLESVLAAKGAGAPDFSEKTGKTVLHMDIGGGTSNLAVCRDGRVVQTGCLNVGGRLLKFDLQGRVTYVSEALEGLLPIQTGDLLSEDAAMAAACFLASVLEMAAGLREKNAAFWQLTTRGTREIATSEDMVISFSGGVADCIENRRPWLEYGDIGPLLGRAIRESRLCTVPYRLGQHTIRATVIGAGCHSTQLSGSTVYFRAVQLPMQNLPVAVITASEQTLPAAELTALVKQRMERLEQWGVLALPGWNAPSYERITALADAVAVAVEDRPCYIALEADMAKALGHALALRLPRGTPCLCIDGIAVAPDSYLDVGSPVGPAISVVIKTLIFSH